MLKTKIIEFSRLLRKGGVNVSINQISSALEAVALVGYAYEDFYVALFFHTDHRSNGSTTF